MPAVRFRYCVLTFVFLAAGCRTQEEATRPYQEPPPPDLRPTVIEYVESDAFDAVLESALVNQDPVIVIQTGHRQPDWGDRLNAWIAAWNRGGKVDARRRPTVRMQAPFVPQVKVDGESIRELRLLIDGLLNRVEDLARQRSAWWADQRVRQRRIELLQPYNLRFHMDEGGFIQVILFNGRYAPQYPAFVRSIARPDNEDLERWARVVTCSQCKEAPAD